MAGAAKPAIRVFYPYPSFFVLSFGSLRPVVLFPSFNPLARSVLSYIFLRSASWPAPSCRPVSYVQSFGPLRPVARLSSFGLFARSVLSSCFLRSILWAAPFCRTSFFVRLLGSLRPVFGFLIFLLAVCRAVPRSRLNRCLFGVRGRVPMAWTGRRAVVFADRWAAMGAVVGPFLPHGNGLGEMTQCGASFIAAHCIVHRSALRLALQRSAFVACLSCYLRRSCFHEEIHRAGLFPDNCFGIHSNPFLPSFQFPSSRVSVRFFQSFSLLCPFSTAASLASSIPFFPSAQVSFPLISTTFVRMKCLLPLVMHAGVWGHAACSPDGSGVWRWGSRYGGID